MLSKTQEDFLWGALIGGAIGAASVLLFTPTTGSELRNQIQDGFLNLTRKKAKNFAKYALNETDEIKKTLKKKVKKPRPKATKGEMHVKSPVRKGTKKAIHPSRTIGNESSSS